MNGIRLQEKKMKKLLLASTLLVSSNLLWASDFTFDRPILNGSGCPQGTTSSVISPDGKAISVLFDEFAVEVPQFDGDNDNDQVSDLNPRRGRVFDENLDHKRCSMLLTADVPQGHVIDSVKIKLDMRGSTYVERGARVRFKSMLKNWRARSTRSTNQAGELITQDVWNANNFQDEWNISKTITIPMNTRCHARDRNKVAFTLTNALMAKINTNSNNQDAYAFSTVDSNDVAGEVNLRIVTRPCGSSGVGNSSGRIRVSDNTRDPNERRGRETREDRDARRRQAGNVRTPRSSGRHHQPGRSVRSFIGRFN